MNLNKPSLIGIKGFKGSGKDTVASMISYILYVGTTKANFDSWHAQHQADIVSNSEIIIHFADKLKDDIIRTICCLNSDISNKDRNLLIELLNSIVDYTNNTELEQDVKIITQKHNELAETVNELKTKVETYSNKINELEQRVHQLENASQS